MKRLNTITLAGFAVCGFLLGMKALDLVEAGITLLLMVWGGYAYGAAAARAPLALAGDSTRRSLKRSRASMVKLWCTVSRICTSSKMTAQSGALPSPVLVVLC